MPDRRWAVARSRLGADPRVRRPPARGGIDWPGVRGTGRRRRLGGLTRAGGRGAAGGRCARAAGLGADRTAGPAGPRPDRRRDGRQPAGAARAATGTDGGRVGRRLRAPRSGPGPRQHRGELPAAGRRPPAPDPAAAAARGGRADRRPGAGVARSHPARDRRRRSATRGRGRPGRVRHQGPVPASAGALGGLPVGVRSGAARGPPRFGGGHRSEARSRPPCLAPGPGRPRARRGRRRRARALGRPGASARRPGRNSRVPGARGDPDGPGGRWPPRTPRSRRARSTRR
jgi:hypothetical protein